jgi:hypothetical protein
MRTKTTKPFHKEQQILLFTNLIVRQKIIVEISTRLFYIQDETQKGSVVHPDLLSVVKRPENEVEGFVI